MTEKTTSIRETIGDNISLSKFAKCLDISRPTLYKYMDAYDSKNIDSIPDNVLKIFDKATSGITKKQLIAYFNEMYDDYVRMEERRLRDCPVPSDIAEIIDREGLEVKDIDLMIERAERHLSYLKKKNPVDEEEIGRTVKDIRDLEYTRDMVEKRQSESRFAPIYSACWKVFVDSDVLELNEDTESDIPGIGEMFRFNLTRAKSGYTLFFYNDCEGDSIEVQLLTGYNEDLTTDIVGRFHPEPGMKYVKIPDLFDEEFEELFRYRIVRSNGDKVLSSAIGEFTV